MSVPNRQIGWSQESNLLWYILSQLKRLASVIYGMKPKYKVYTALLTQSGGDSPNLVIDLPLTIGVTYEIMDNDGGTADFTNVGAPNNNVGTFFIATGTTPNSWGDNLLGQLQYNEGAPVATVLENTIGNIWFTYNDVGDYQLNLSDGINIDKTFLYIGNGPSGGGRLFFEEEGFKTITIYDSTTIWIYVTLDGYTSGKINGRMDNTPIEIRVYN